MTLVSIFLLNATFSFALSLALASLLGPDGFGQYAIGLSITLVVNTAVFEWLRLSTSRFYGERARIEDPAIRATLNRAYWASGGALALVTAGMVASGRHPGNSPRLIAAAALCGLAYGFCEYRMALARARFLEGPYAVLGLMRACLGFLLAAGAALLWNDPALVLVGAALAAFLPIAAVLRRLADPPGAGPSGALVTQFARYALPLVAASALYQCLPLLNRTLLAGRDGLAEAGYFSLASELATRLFQNLGAALDLVLFQLVVRADDLHGRESAEQQVTRNAALIAGIVIPAGAGLWAVWPSFESVFIPAAFRGQLERTAGFMIPALVAFALVQYALNPVFQLRRQTAPVIAAAAAALAIDVAAVSLWPGLAGSAGFAAAQLAAFAGGLVILAGVAVATGARLPWRDAGVSVAGSCLMLIVLWPLRGRGDALGTLALQVPAGIAVYGTVALAFDLAGLRTALIRRLRPRLARLSDLRP